MLCHSKQDTAVNLSILDGETWAYRIILANEVNQLLRSYLFLDQHSKGPLMLEAIINTFFLNL